MKLPVTALLLYTQVPQPFPARGFQPVEHGDRCSGMSSHCATVRWAGPDHAEFAKGRYSRAHEWTFDGGATVPASASPHIVPEPWSDPASVDPEEAFVASLSSCHMLFFIDFARRAGFSVSTYVDEAEGRMEARADGRMVMSRVRLRPRIQWCGDRQPHSAEIADLHHKAHEACFIANSVTTLVTVEQ